MNQFRTAAKIAWRETRASSGRFLFVILAVAAGVGALTGVRGFANGFDNMLKRDARNFMAADLSVRTFATADANQERVINQLKAAGVQETLVTETLTMAMPASGGFPLLISVKAVDPQVYPFYGTLKFNPEGDIRKLLTPDAVIVADGVLLRLNAKLGDEIKIGQVQFKIVAEVISEPDRMTGSINVGPRMMLSRAGFERTGLLIPGSRAAERFLFKLPAQQKIQDVRADLKKVFKEGLIADYSEAHPLIEQGLRQSTTFLSLVSLIALVIGALGVATAIQAHLQQKMDSIAVMKCLGAKSGQILQIYVLQTAGLGIAGSILGIGLGSLVQLAFPFLLAKYFTLSSAPGFDPISAVQGLAVGLLTVLIFTVPPLLGIRDIRPAIIFRREMTAPRTSWLEWLKKAGVSIVSSILILAFVGGIAAWLSDAWKTGLYFAIAIAVGLLALAIVAWVLLRSLRLLSRNLPRAAGPVVRQGIANLYRPGNHAGAAVMALGVGVMFTVTVWIVQRGLLQDIVRTAPPGTPNVYLLDVTSANRDAVYKLVSSQQGLLNKPEMVGATPAQIKSIDGVAMNRENLKGMARRYSRGVAVTTASEKPGFTQVMEGEWWEPGKKLAMPEVSVADNAAKLLNLKVGSVMDWVTPQKSFTARVAAIHKSESVRLTARIEFYFSPGPLDSVPTIYYGGFRAKPEAVPRIQKALFDNFPTVTVINMADVLDTIQSVVDQISTVINFISGFSILAGAVILASSIAGTRFRRIREVVILKTLGASRGRIAQIFSIEFFVIGAVAGMMGGVLAGGFAWAALNKLLKANASPDYYPMAMSILLTAVLAVGTGWLASYRTLGQKPLEILREE